MSNARLKLAKNQANAKQHPEIQLLLFENYAYFLSTLSSKNNGTCRSHTYYINRPRSRRGHKYSEYKKCLSTIMLIYIKQHLSSI